MKLSALLLLRFFSFSWGFILTSWSAEAVFPMGPLEEIIIKQVPSYQMVLCKERSFKQLDDAYLKLTRYTVGQGFGVLKPLILQLPSLDWDPKQRLIVALPLPIEKQNEWPKDPHLFLEERESNRVISIAFQGAYEFETIEPRLKQLKQWMKDKKLIAAGPPQLLLYHYRSVRFHYWRAAELQQPIR